ncbi:MAG: class I SAM-dependent methyltransferase [Telluria sp.]
MFEAIKAKWWRFTPGQLLEKLSTASFDRMHGTETSTFSELRELDIASDNKRYGERYQPSPVYSLRLVLKNLGIRYADFSFIDLGSGKGRTLLVASEFPFKQILGVEFSEALHRKAEQNIARYRPRFADRIKPVHADATQFVLPAGDLVLYLFNPFTKPVLDKVLANVMASVADQPRRVILVYLYLPSEEWLDGLAGFRHEKTWRNYHVFQSVALADKSIAA